MWAKTTERTGQYFVDLQEHPRRRKINARFFQGSFSRKNHNNNNTKITPVHAFQTGLLSLNSCLNEYKSPTFSLTAWGVVSLIMHNEHMVARPSNQDRLLFLSICSTSVSSSFSFFYPIGSTSLFSNSRWRLVFYIVNQTVICTTGRHQDNTQSSKDLRSAAQMRLW